jgi:hypothetical protein
LNVVCAYKQKRPELVHMFITPIGFWGLGFERNSWTFAQTVGQRQGSVPKDQLIVGQPVVERSCAPFATLVKCAVGRIAQAPTSSGMPNNRFDCGSNPQPFNDLTSLVNR